MRSEGSVKTIERDPSLHVEEMIRVIHIRIPDQMSPVSGTLILLFHSKFCVSG
jgi:hypothetical protein